MLSDSGTASTINADEDLDVMIPLSSALAVADSPKNVVVDVCGFVVDCCAIWQDYMCDLYKHAGSYDAIQHF